MNRREAFALAARVDSAGTCFRVARIRLGPPRSESHEVLVENRRTHARRRLRSFEDWHDLVARLARRPSARQRRALETLLWRVRWAGGADRPARGDLRRDYERIAGALASSSPVQTGDELESAVLSLLGAEAATVAR